MTADQTIKNDVNDVNDNKKSKTSNNTSGLIEFLLNSELRIFIDQFNEPYVAINGDGTNVIKVDSREFKQWISLKLYEKQQTASSEAVKTTIDTLCAKALYENNKYDLNVRTAQDEEGNYWYDLGEKAVKINASGWEIIDKPPILFRRFKNQKQQVEPRAKGNIYDFFDLINIKNDDDTILLLVFIITCLISGFPHTVLVVYGQHGSAKSTLLRLIKELVDPSEITLLPPFKNSDQLIQAVAHNWIAFFDNLSSLKKDMSDHICRMCTGMSTSKRKLYTDDDDFIYRIQHVIGFNGINNVVTMPDLLERSLLVELSPIPKEKRKTEEDINKKFQEIKPFLLGHCLDVIVVALNKKLSIPPTSLNRMADFTKWGYAIAEAVGCGGDSFLKAYKNNISKQHKEAIEANPVGTVIMKMIEQEPLGKIKDTPTNILVMLNEKALMCGIEPKYNKYWPKDPLWLWRKLKDIKPNLEAEGIIIDKEAGFERSITIEKKSIADCSPEDEVQSGEFVAQMIADNSLEQARDDTT